VSGAAVVLVVVLVYAGVCWAWPIGTHMRCRGTGRLHQPFSGRTKWRTCGGCGGSGVTVRLGRRLFGWFIGPYE
jgi:hypothetical protein